MNTNNPNFKPVWGKKPLELPKNWPDVSGVPTSLKDLEALFGRMPRDKLYVRVPGGKPTSGQPQRIDLQEISDLETRMIKGDPPLHVQAIDLHLYDEGYGQALTRFLDAMKDLLPEVDWSRTKASTGLFLSTGGAVAPFHADYEHNFLIQLVGDKHMHHFPSDDLEVFTSEAREGLACDRKHMLDTYRPEIESRGQVFYLEPGSALYHPPMSPHWVDTGRGSYSLSMTISLVPPDVDRMLLLHKLNRRLRRMGLRPSPVGHSPASDAFKAKIAVAMRGVKRSL